MKRIASAVVLLLLGAAAAWSAGTVVHAVQTFSPVTHQFLTGLDTAGALSASQPACTDLSDAGNGCTGTLPVGANPTATAGASAVNGSAATFMRSDGAPALQAASAGTAGIAKLYSPVMGIGWIAGTDPANAIIAVANQALTVQAIIGVPEVALGAAATIDIFDAASGVACGSGTKVTTTAFDANGTAATNQALLAAPYALASGHRLCLQDTTGGTNFPSGNSIATISVFANPS